MPPRLSARLAASLLLAGVCFASAQEIAPKDEVSQQLAAMREAVIQQTRQIDLLTAEVARINQMLRSRRPASSEPASTAPIATPSALPPTASPVAPAMTGVETPVAAAPPNAPSPGGEHVVAKGEYLAVIAKKYNTTVEDLEKLNNITDPRKIQVGQILKLPLPSTPPTPTP